MSAVCIIALQEYFSKKFIELSLIEALLDLEKRIYAWMDRLRSHQFCGYPIRHVFMRKHM